MLSCCHFVVLLCNIIQITFSWQIQSEFKLPQVMRSMIYSTYNDTVYILGAELFDASEINDHILLYNDNNNKESKSFVRINEAQPDAGKKCSIRCAITFNHIIYLFASNINNLGTIWLFDTISNKFITNHNIPTMPHPVYKSLITADYVNNLIYLIGGVDEWVDGSWQKQIYTNQVQALNVATKQWLATSNFAETPVTFRTGSCEYYNGKIFVFGGITRIYGDYHSENNVYHDYIYKYDVALNAWTKLDETLPVPSNYHSSVLCTVNNWIYIVGGSDGNEALTSVNIFDPETETMLSSYDDLIFPRSMMGLVQLNQMLFVFGGWNGAMSAMLDTIEISNIISLNPTENPTLNPTGITVNPTSTPTNDPSSVPTYLPTSVPTSFPSNIPSFNPSSFPSLSPTAKPTVLPSIYPTMLPSNDPSSFPTFQPSKIPTIIPTVPPTFHPSNNPSFILSIHPTFTPTFVPTTNPTSIPTEIPTTIPTNIPSVNPSHNPYKFQPTVHPILTPTVDPTTNPISISSTIEAITTSMETKEIWFIVTIVLIVGFIVIISLVIGYNKCYNKIKPDSTTTETQKVSGNKPIKYKRVAAEYTVNDLTLNYEKWSTWSTQEVIFWITHELNNGKYEKYETILKQSLTEREFVGKHLKSVIKDDLHSFGIKSFEDKLNIMQEITELIRESQKVETLYH